MIWRDRLFVPVNDFQITHIEPGWLLLTDTLSHITPTNAHLLGAFINRDGRVELDKKPYVRASEVAYDSKNPRAHSVSISPTDVQIIQGAISQLNTINRELVLKINTL
jgi:hypothetical protein